MNANKCELVINGQMFLMDARAALYVMDALMSARPVLGMRKGVNGVLEYLTYANDGDALTISARKLPAHVRLMPNFQTDKERG